VSDEGIARLHDLPIFKAWHGFDPELWLTQFAPEASFLMLRGPFTNQGLANLAGLDGLFGLNVDSSQLAITGASLAPLADLAHFAWLAFDAKDESMPYIAALPHLRFLMCQDTSAGDEGFTALSRSRTIEYIWGRRCHNLRRRGFTALADMPALGALSVSCLNVDDVGLSALPRFRALRELMPMDVPDEGYRHVAACRELESLVLMYCRDTTDRATEHIRNLPHLRKYFASYNRITDRTPEMLSGTTSLEEITFDSCAGLTDRGIGALARLPRLRQLRVSGMPRVTSEVIASFPARVAVSHSV
jgi:Leucine-rich repeat (LRR) protein